MLTDSERRQLFCNKSLARTPGCIRVGLDPATFAGTVISDDAAVYRNFTRSQKCWAHLLRKAIKLTLQDPNNADYRRFADRLLSIYRDACRARSDGRLSDAGRTRKIATLDDQIFELCEPMWGAGSPPVEPETTSGRFTLRTEYSTTDGRPAAVLAVAVDITTQKKLEDRVRQAQKLEAVGQLAGGVAHDFNNLLTVVNGCAELMLDTLAADAPARRLAEDVLRAGERGAALTRQLLAFSRQQMLRVEVFDPNRVLVETAKLLSRLLGEDVTLRTALNLAAGFVKGDVGQVEQVIINLAVNGRDAMPRGGTLVIETAPVDVADADLPQSPDAQSGRYVRLSFTDTGTGMPPDVQARLFEPFFTTKPAGKGTGLGLATVYGIVRQSGGFLTVQSAVGKGTTFAVYLPRHEPEAVEPKSALRAAPRAPGNETVLVVEDDDAVRMLTTMILRRQGYRVETAESGAAALAVCDRLSAPPDLVLSDVIMPGMSGRELAEALTVKYPRLKVVFLSGYTADAVLRHGVEEDRVAFLQKPYTPDVLARFVRDTLDQN